MEHIERAGCERSAWVRKDKMVAGDPVVHLHGGVQASVKYRAAALGAAPLRAAQMECAHRPRPSCATEL